MLFRRSRPATTPAPSPPPAADDTAALFALAGVLREKNLTLSFDTMRGVAKAMPIAGLLFGFAAFASIGLPGFGNFASELMVFFGAFRQGTSTLQFSPMQVATVFALWGVVI